MNRLTDKDSGYLVNDETYASGKNSQCKEMTGNYSKEVVEEAIDRLAAYEDTGLEPEEIVKVQEVLGTTAIPFGRFCITRRPEQGNPYITQPYKAEELMYWPTTVYLTHEQAEAELKGAEHE